MKYIQQLLICALLLAAPALLMAQPVVRYIAPDAAAPGMSVVIDVIGPSTVGNFGVDGAYPVGDKIALQSPGDSIYAKLGPAIVSWNGKLVQVMILVEPTTTNRTITLVVKNGANQTPFNFSVVTSQNIPPQTGGGVLGGNIGTRTSRNTMIVDSLILRNGTYTVSMADLSLGQAGNQAYLPLRILSKGPIRLENATLDIKGKNGSDGSHGGPGGGGGGGGSLRNGGDGFTGGGGVGPAPRKGGAGTGSDVGSQQYHGGFSLNGVEGGFGTEYNNPSANNDEGGGGGTGHPFGTSGTHGLYGANSAPGGRGAGSGGGQGAGFPTLVTYGGGGAGYATKGAQGGGNGDNGGLEVGNKMIVPFTGGSGGGSGNIWYQSGPTGHGGGGGGAVEVTSFKSIDVIGAVIDASGGTGSNGTAGGAFDLQHGSGGGGGSGGAINLVARDSIHIRTAQSSQILNVNGGNGGTGYNGGGAGGKGRVRLDGRVSWKNGFNNSIQFYDPAKDYVGPVITKVDTIGKRRITISGYGAGWEGTALGAVQIHYRFPSTGWTSALVATAIEAGSRTGAWSLLIDRTTDIFDTTIYIVVMQRNSVVATTPFTHEPDWVMSHASGIIADLPGIPLIAQVEDTIDFGKLRVGLCKDSSFIVRSIGSAQLEVGRPGLEGDVAQFVLRTTDSLHLPPSTQGNIGVAFCPQDTGCFEALVRIKSNDTERVVRLVGCGIRPEIFTLSEIDFGPVRFGTCKDTTFTVTNPGSDTLTITRQVFTNTSFVGVAPPLPLKIAPKESAQFTVRYCPAGAGSETGFDTIKSDALVQNWPIRLLGRSVRGRITSEDLLDFGEVLVGACKDSFITITNVGDDSVFLNDAPTLSAFFTVLPGQLPIVLASAESAQLFIRFCPTDEIVYTASDSIRPVTPTEARFLSVRGKGIKGLLSIPNAIDYGCVVIGETIVDTLLIENTGSARVLNITTSAAPAELTILRPLGNQLEVAQRDSIIVSFTPTTVGSFRGEIRVTADGQPDLQIPYTANVTVAPTLEYSRRLIQYDTVLEGTTKTECVTVMNPSCKPLTISSTSLAIGEVAFSIDPKALPVTLSDSATFEFCVTANSLTSGIYVDTLVINTSVGRFADVVLEARVETIRLKLEPAMLDFGTVLARVPPPSQQARLINISSQAAKISTPTIVGPNANEFAYTGGVTILAPGDTAFYDVSYLASIAGSHTGYFVAYTGEKLDSVLLIGTALPNIPPVDTIEVIVKSDTMAVLQGRRILLPVRVTDITGGAATVASFRVQFDPMRVSLGGTHIVNAIFKSATVVQHSFGDFTITALNPDTAVGAGAIVYLHMEILAGVANEVPIRLSEVTFPNSLTQAVEVNDGLLLVQECDTTENIQMGAVSEVAAIRPNPARDKASIPVKLLRDASVSVTVYNTLGQIVRQVAPLELQVGEHMIDVSLDGLPQSTYIYEVQCKDREKIESHRGNLNIE